MTDEVMVKAARTELEVMAVEVFWVRYYLHRV